MKKKTTALMLGLCLVLASGCGKANGADEYQGEHWYEGYRTSEYETIMLKEISRDSISDTWDYGCHIGVGQDLASDEEWYYCYNYLDGGKLYRISKSDFSRKEKLSDMVAYNINVIDGKVYFYNQEESKGNGAGIYSMNTDGSGLTYLSVAIPSDLQVVNEWIYYIDQQKGGIYKLHPQSKEPILLTELPDVRNLRVEGNTLYFLYGQEEQFTLARMDVNGENLLEAPAPDKGNCGGLVVNGGEIYYAMENEKIIKADPATLEMVETFEVSISDGMNLVDGYLYFLNGDAADAIARMDVTTGEVFTSEHSYISDYTVFDGMMITTTTREAQPLVRVNRLEDGSPVAFFE